MLYFYKYLKVTILLLFCMLTACASNTSAENNELVGIITKDKLLTNDLSFRQNYQKYSLDEADREAVNRWPENLHIDIYFATWCHDSQREVPKILSILESSQQASFRLVALDDEKKYPQRFPNATSIKFTPTFVIFLGNKEIGRIIERPSDSLVKDITRFYIDSLKIID